MITLKERLQTVARQLSSGSMGTFGALIGDAYMRADSRNAHKLVCAFPILFEVEPDNLPMFRVVDDFGTSASLTIAAIHERAYIRTQQTSTPIRSGGDAIAPGTIQAATLGEWSEQELQQRAQADKILNPGSDDTSLVNAVVNAKLAYWDALRRLEQAFAPCGEFSDRANDAVIEAVDLIAAGVNERAECTKRQVAHIRTLARKA